METEPYTDTPETDANDEAWAYNMQYDTFNSLMDDPLPWDEFARKLERERDEAVRSCHIWQKGHSDIVAERDLWKTEATRWRDMYMEYDEMLESQVQEAVNKLNKIWADLDKLKKKVTDEL
jgi:hypothetical protein